MNEATSTEEAVITPRARGRRAGVGLVVGGLVALGALGLYGARRRAEDEVDQLDRRLLREGMHGFFHEDAIASLPEPARRFLVHAIAPGTPLASVARLELGGRLRRWPGAPWVPFRARETIAPPHGFVWRARIGSGPSPFQAVGHDLLGGGHARVAWWAWGLLPVLSVGGSDLARSAAGRLALHALWVPASLLPSAGAQWVAIDADTAEVTLPIDGVAPKVRITVDSEGRLVRAEVSRWRVDDGEPRLEPYGFDRVLSEGTFGGYRVPTHVVVGWQSASSRAFRCYEPRITRIAYG